ncbi:MAG: GHMP kinase [Promethearchaeota archaeon]|nr:MAG: GHMP kinase [Candidatus Lokiarchaeota archaeon]
MFSRAPVRICDIGGWTDTWFYNRGAVFNFAVDLYSSVRIEENKEDKIKIVSENLDLITEIQDFRKIEYDGTLDLLKAAVNRMEIKSGLDIFVRADAPPGCGTGTSASIAVALIAALARYSRRSLTPHQIAELAHKLETEELNLESGVQDQFAAAYGGINFMEIDYPSVKVSNINVNEKRICELENQFILVYLSSRSSSEMHKAVIENYEKGQISTIEAFEIMKNCAYAMRKAINSSGIEEIGEIMNRNWEAQKLLHPLMINPIIKKVEKIAKENGALGFKCNGAGGGGSVTILAGIGNEFKIKKRLAENGLTVLPAKLNFKGVQTWEI